MQKHYPEVYRFYQHYYQNPVGAHIGCIVLQYLKDNGIGENVKQVGSYLKKSLQQFAGPDKLLAEVKGDGLNLYLKMNDKVFPLNWFSKITTIGRPMGSMMFTHICMRRANLLPFFNRFTPPLNCTRAQADVIIKKVETILAINPWQLLFIGLGQVMMIFLVSRYRKFKQLFNPSNNRR
jgi:acetylornithine/succinyldiaminopimelate/putrescine aminotransferase